VTLPPRARMTLGALTATLLGGLLGLGWWTWRHRPGHPPAARFRLVPVALAAAGLLLIAVGSAWRLGAAIESVPACSPPSGPETPSGRGSLDAALVSEQAATWPETGIGLMYAQATDAHICWSRSQDYYVAVNEHHIAGSRAMNMGDIVLSPGFHISREQLSTLVGHEARHRTQWAVLTVIGGPFAFPVAYAVDDFFFPGSRNHFERLAGLESGGYRHSGSGPVLGPAQLATLCALAAIIVVAVLVARHRRSSARSRSRR
jgi:hypothetical protein